jgi:membrane-associated protein
MLDQLIDLFFKLIDFFQHLPDYLHMWATAYGSGVYWILAAIIFCETGLVVTPILPGDSLLFATGAILALDLPGLNLPTMCVVLIIAAILGDMVNYHIGKWAGPRIFRGETSRWLNPKHLDKTREFYAKHGGKTIILARFIPIVRTYAPFVAGMSGMKYSQFFAYNVVGGIVWIVSFTVLGYYFGTLPVVKSNFQYIVLGIIVVSFFPVVFEFWKARREKAKAVAGL